MQRWLPCVTDTKDYNVDVGISDGAVKPNTIGQASETEAGATNPLSVKSKLEHPLVITPEHQGDYVQFTLGGLSWKSSDKACDTSKWDPSEPFCGGGRDPQIIVA
ncbi:hypothetical protein GP486_008770, partial [Trichoglossum hirsutum]